MRNSCKNQETKTICNPIYTAYEYEECKWENDSISIKVFNAVKKHAQENYGFIEL